MAETIQTFLAQVKEAAVALGEQETVDLVSAVQQQSGGSRLRLLIVGAPGVGRFSLANVLLGQHGLLPASPIPRFALPVTIKHGDTTAIAGLDSDGIAAPIAAERLRPFLTSPESDAADYLELQITTTSDLLNTCELRIETLGTRRGANDWKELLAASDYALLVLNAVALLSEQERRFVREILQPHFGLERVAIVINQMDLVAGHERASIAELVRTFLGSFESQPVLIEFSAAQASADPPAPTSGHAELMHLLQHDLLNRYRALRGAAMRQAAETCLAEFAAALQRVQALLSTSEAELQQLLDRLDPQSAWLQERTGRAQHRIEAFVNTLVKEQSLREIEAFSTALREQLPDEILQVREVALIKRHLPGYIEALWMDFFNTTMPALRNQLIDELQQIGELVASDLRELAGSQAPGLHEALHGFDPVPASMKAFVMPARGHHPAGTTATWMQVGGLALLIPIPQISLLLIGVGQVIRAVFQRQIVAADKQAMSKSVIDTIYELERQVRRQVEQRFATLTDELKQAVAEMYTQGIASMRAALDESISRHAAVSTQREQVDSLARETLPALQQKLDRLTGGTPPNE